MESGGKEEKKDSAVPDSLTRAVLRALALAPAGFVAGYVFGRALGNVVAGCPLFGACNELLPVLIAIVIATIGMGVGCTLAAARVGLWWEGVTVWGAGISAMLALVVVIGGLGHGTTIAQLLALAWLIAGAIVMFAGSRRQPI